MPFTNPIIAGNTLVREAIQSPNYTPGISGWAIKRDGTAEFASVVLRGANLSGNISGQVSGGTNVLQSPNYTAGSTGWAVKSDGSAEFSNAIIRGQLTVSNANGSSTRIYNDTVSGVGPVVEMKPPTSGTYGAVTTPGRLRVGTDPNVASNPGLLLQGPLFGNTDLALLLLARDANGSYTVLNGGGHADVIASSYVQLYAPEIRLTGNVVISGNATDINGREYATTPSGTTGQLRWNDVTVTTNASGIGTVTHGAGFTPTGAQICQMGATGSTGVNLLLISGSFTSTTFQIKATTSTGVFVGNIGVSFVVFG